MAQPTSIQRNVYKGSPPRCWLRAELISPNGLRRSAQFLADTGNPFPIIVGVATMRQCQWMSSGASVSGPYGPMRIGTVQIAIDEIGLTTFIDAFECPWVEASAKRSHQDFDGLVGLPVLRLTDYGGNDTEFWVKPLSTLP